MKSVPTGFQEKFADDLIEYTVKACLQALRTELQGFAILLEQDATFPVNKQTPKMLLDNAISYISIEKILIANKYISTELKKCAIQQKLFIKTVRASLIKKINQLLTSNSIAPNSLKFTKVIIYNATGGNRS